MPQPVRDEFEEYFQGAPTVGMEEIPVEAPEGTEPSVPPEESLVAGQEVAQPDVWEQRYKSFQGIANQQLAAQEARIKELERLIAQMQPPSTEPTPGSTEEPSPTKGSEESSNTFPPEAQKAIEEFITEYPEIAQPVGMLLEKVQKETLKAIDDKFKEVIQQVESKVGDIDGFKKDVAAELTSQKLLAKHPDFMDILASGQLEQWIQAQPPDVQQQLVSMANSANPNDAIALLDQFKSATQQSPTSQTAGLSPQEVQAPQQEALGQSPMSPNPKLQATEAIPSRVATPKTAPATTFDEAFEEAIKGLTKK
jgi:hypothetical protein